MKRLAMTAAAAAMGLAAAATPPASAGQHGATRNFTGLMMPRMDPEDGRRLFAAKGCVVCHSVNGVGGEDAPPLDVQDMPMGMMNPFEFAARMWRGAGAMIELQEDELGGQIELTGEELANIIAFVHDTEEQKRFSEKDIPEDIAKLMGHMTDDAEEHHEGDLDPEHLEEKEREKNE